MSGAGARSPAQIEADIEVTRARLAGTIDQLAFRAQPKQIVARQVKSSRRSFYEATHNEDGSLRTERISAVLAATAVVLLGIGLIRRAVS
jgi:hypothetical protein